MEHEPTTVNVWAPELFYDEANKQFIICWASTIPGRFADNGEPHDNNQRMYYTTTSDFKTFAPAKLFFDPGFSVIDGTIVKKRGREFFSAADAATSSKPNQAEKDSRPLFVLVLKENSRPKRALRVA